MEQFTEYSSFSDFIAAQALPAEMELVAQDCARFMNWLLEEPEKRIPAWVAATEQED